MFSNRDVRQERNPAQSGSGQRKSTVKKNTNSPTGGPGGALPADALWVGSCPCAAHARTAVQKLNSHGFAVARSPRPARTWPFYAHAPALTPRT